MAHFERDLVPGPACITPVIGVELHSIAINQGGPLHISHSLTELQKVYDGVVRSIMDVSQLAQFVEQDMAEKGVKGPLVGMWATQLCANHGKKDDTVKTLQLEHLGSWLFPTAEAAAVKPVPVVVEEPFKFVPWKATTYRANEKGNPVALRMPLFGITLPQPGALPEHRLKQAILLARSGREEIYGLMHTRLENPEQFVERVVAPALPGQERRPHAGTLFGHTVAVTPEATQV